MLFLLAITAAFLIGFYAPKLSIPNAAANKIIHFLVVSILCVMGYRVGVDIQHYQTGIMDMAITVAIISLVLLVMTSVVVHWLLAGNQRQPRPIIVTSNKRAIIESCSYLLLTALGVVVGYQLAWESAVFSAITNTALLTILFLVAQDMRAQGYALKDVITNREGLYLSLVVIISAMLTAVVICFLLDIEFGLAVVLTSGFGWYTLSGPLASQLITPLAGAEVFFIDLLREVLALSLIPVLSRFSYFVPVGYSGATAFDFTLPLLRENLGIEVVPIAVTSGTILSVVAPFMIILGSSLVA